MKPTIIDSILFHFFFFVDTHLLKARKYILIVIFPDHEMKAVVCIRVAEYALGVGCFGIDQMVDSMTKSIEGSLTGAAYPISPTQTHAGSLPH